MRVLRAAAILVIAAATIVIARPALLAQRQTAANVARSPATLALASASGAPNLSDQVREALTSDQPALRLTAAHVASIGNLTHLVPDLVRTLERETDPRSAAVEMRGGPPRIDPPGSRLRRSRRRT